MNDDYFVYNVKNAFLWGNCSNNFKKANIHSAEGIGRGILAAFEAIPLIGQVISLFELLAHKIKVKKQQELNVTEKKADQVYTGVYLKGPEPQSQSQTAQQDTVAAKKKAAQDTNASTLEIAIPKTEVKEGGNKTEGIKRAQEILRENPLRGVFFPGRRNISSDASLQFLQAKCPEIFTKRSKLEAAFRKCPPEEKYSFLEKEEVRKELTEIREAIKETFENGVEHFKSDSALCTWFDQIKKNNSYLMVRSDGVEDLADIANAGGNLSEKYIKPELEEVLPSCGRVIASYFGESSLRNLISGDINPFEDPLQLSVILHELIGESPGGKDSDIPASLVMFTNEPNYSEQKFGVTTISAALGHGEGVVNNEKVQTDTVYAVRSRARPGKLVEVYQNCAKPERLAPQMRDGQISLELTKNAPELVNQRCLSKEMVARLVQLAELMENSMGKPMDMEIVIKNDRIYIVQMRDVKREKARPCYLSDEALSQTPIPALVAEQQAKVLVAAQGNVHEVTKKDEVLICNTLKEADEKFKKLQHKIVIVAKDEPSNSHPVINFNNKSIPCIFTKDLAKAREIVQKLGPNRSAVLCPQSGRFCSWNRNVDLKTCVREGYFSHPAPMNLSTGEVSLPFAQKATSKAMPTEVKEALFAFKTATSQNAALDALNKLRQSAPVTKLKAIIDKWQPTKESTPEAKARIKLLEKLNKRVEKSFKEIEASVKEGAPQLEKLFQIKILSSLFHQEKSQALNSFSLSDTETLAEEIQKSIAYQSKLSSPAKYIDLLPVGSRAFGEKDRDKWENFLLALESTQIEPKEIEQFKQLLYLLMEYDQIPKWFSLIFLPEVNKEKTAVEILNALLKGTEDTKSISIYADLLQDLSGLISIVPQFADPEQFEESWEKVARTIKFFSNLSIADTEKGPPIVRLLMRQAMRQYVEVMDDLTKALKGSLEYADKKKMKHMKQILEKNLETTGIWGSSIFPPLVFPDCVKGNPGMEESYEDTHARTKIGGFEKYLNKVKEILKKCDVNNSENLEPSKEFSVLAAVYGNRAPLERHEPRTLEDLFTLIHQNQLDMLQRLDQQFLSDAILGRMDLPPILKESMEKIELQFKGVEDIHRTGIEITDDSLRLFYNVPLYNHSMSLTLDWDRSSGLRIQTKFFGRSGPFLRRWAGVSEIAKAFESAGWIKGLELTDYTEQEVQLSYEVADSKALEHVQFVLGIMCNIANQSPLAIEQLSKQIAEEDRVRIGEALFWQKDDLIKSPPDPTLANNFLPFLSSFWNSALSLNAYAKIEQSYCQSDDVNLLNDEIVHLTSLLNRSLQLNIKHNIDISAVLDLLIILIPKYQKYNVEQGQLQIMLSMINKTMKVNRNDPGLVETKYKTLLSILVIFLRGRDLS